MCSRRSSRAGFSNGLVAPRQLPSRSSPSWSSCSFNDYGPDYAGIQDPTRPGQEFGGLNAIAASGRGDGVTVLARTDDADASLASVLAAGGRIVVELAPYPGGRRFKFADPWGNVLGIYEPAE